MKVRALVDGYYNGERRHVGAIFVLKPGHKLGKWMEEVVEVPATTMVAKPGKEASPPQTLSEISKVTEKERIQRALKKGLPTEVLDAEGSTAGRINGPGG